MNFHNEKRKEEQQKTKTTTIIIIIYYDCYRIMVFFLKNQYTGITPSDPQKDNVCTPQNNQEESNYNSEKKGGGVPGII